MIREPTPRLLGSLPEQCLHGLLLAGVLALELMHTHVTPASPAAAGVGGGLAALQIPAKYGLALALLPWWMVYGGRLFLLQRHLRQALVPGVTKRTLTRLGVLAAVTLGVPTLALQGLGLPWMNALPYFVAHAAAGVLLALAPRALALPLALVAWVLFASVLRPLVEGGWAALWLLAIITAAAAASLWTLRLTRAWPAGWRRPFATQWADLGAEAEQGSSAGTSIDPAAFAHRAGALRVLLGPPFLAGAGVRDWARSWATPLVMLALVAVLAAREGGNGEPAVQGGIVAFWAVAAALVAMWVTVINHHAALGGGRAGARARLTELALLPGLGQSALADLRHALQPLRQPRHLTVFLVLAVAVAGLTGQPGPTFAVLLTGACAAAMVPALGLANLGGMSGAANLAAWASIPALFAASMAISAWFSGYPDGVLHLGLGLLAGTALGNTLIARHCLSLMRRRPQPFLQP